MRDTALVLHVDQPKVTGVASRRLPAEEPALTVVTAETAAEGLEILRQRPVECVVSDYALPDEDGLSFLRAVREREPDMPFLLFTGRGSEGVASEAIAAGVTDYIRKSAATEQYSLLANRVRNAVEGYRAEQTVERRARQQEIVADLGQRALSGVGLSALFDAAVEGVADGLDVAHVALFEREGTTADGDGAGTFSLRASVDWLVSDGGTVAKRGPLADAVVEEEPVVERELERSVPGEVDVESCVCVPVEGTNGEPWGVLAACHRRPRAFPRDEVSFVRSVANVVAGELDRQDRISELELKDQAFDDAPAGIVITDPERPDNPIVYASDSFCELTGYDRETALGRNCRFLQGPDTDPAKVDRMRAAIDAGEPVAVELRNYRADGTEFWNRVEIAPVEDEDGEVTAYVGFQEDVTDRREREQQVTRLHEATRELVDADDEVEVARTVVDASRDVLGFDLSGVRLVEDDQLVPTAMTDTRSAVLGPATPYDLDGDAPPARAYRDGETVVVEDFERTGDAEGREPLESAIYLPLGEHGTLSVGTTETADLSADDRRLLDVLASNAAVALDRLNEQRRVVERERQLQQERDKLAALFDNSLDPTIEYAYEPTDDGGTEPVVEDVNDAFERVFGYDRAAAVGEHVDDLVVPPERRASAEEIDRQVRAGERVDREVRRQTADGRLRDFRFRNIPIPDAHDRRGFAVYTDVSQRKAREQRLQVLNRVLRHNLRNDMNVILGVAELVKRDLDDPTLAEKLETISRVGERLLDRSSFARTIEETLSEAEDRTRVDVVELAAHEASLLAERYPEATVTTDLPETAQVRASEQLRAALQQLLNNAVEHNDDPNPTVTVEVERRTRGDQRFVGVTVTDDGPGIPEHERQVLVEGAEKPLQHGSGLGLWLARWVVHGAGGWLDIELREPRGTAVTMYLPATDEA